MIRTKILLTLLSLILFSTPGHALAPLTKNCAQKFISLPMTRQSNEYTCGAAAALSIVRYYGDDEALESEVAAELKTQPKTGTFHKTMIEFFKGKGYEVQAQENMSLTQLKDFISQGKPVICLIQAWEDDITDYSNHWGIGHYVIAIGYDADRIYFMDPMVLGNYAYLPTQEFMQRWHQLTLENKQLKQWGMALSKGPSQFRPDEIIYIP